MRGEFALNKKLASLLGLDTFLSVSHAVIQEADEGIIVTDSEGHILLANPAFETVTGYTQEEVLGKKPNILRSGLHDRVFYENMWETIRDHGVWKGEIWNKRKNGELFVEWLTIKAIYDATGNPTHYVAIFSDVTQHKRTMEQLARLSNYDLLTNVPNRQLFTKRLQHLLDMARRYNQQLAILFLDLDRFKYINDELGHYNGDVLLKKVANRLKKLLRTKDTLARIGGDEFVVILPKLKDVQEAVSIAEQMIESLQAPFMLNGKDVYMSVSIGISMYSNDGDDGETLLRRADRAMQKAKENGRNRFELYTAKLDYQSEVVMLENYLRKAIERNELFICYQPIVNMKTKKIEALEALIRWQQPNIGFISPGQFIPLAEETGLIVPITKWLFEQACIHIKAIHQFAPHMKIGMNISAVHFQQDDFVEQLSTIVKQNDVHPRFFKLELTESTIMPNAEESVQKLVQLKQCGFKLAIDDFGTGFSSLSYLHRFPIDILKIDQSFIRRLSLYSDDATIVSTIIMMAHHLHLSVVAEGVETEQQYEFLNKQQCDMAQGYYIAKPMPIDEVQHFVQEWNEYINER
ncbi:putative bifunctional diguanylate cyclase/phosphodiesterase [Anoxybacillus suryakundensis]|uniref:putative bifunctional diguanylate cyclase/phosphodiesterase n=1 Tax=Anoxybacillus suryakundensis TaxID=1325335 RepID=UPI0006E12F25|nr:EAL domain-containing protein [Anoxybacillus suryakundensis]